MIKVIDNLINELKAFQESADTVVIGIVREKQGFILGLNRDQLFSGKDANGDEILPPYAESTVKRKRRKGSPYDRVTLKDEGEYHQSLEIDFGPDSFLIGSNDSKAIYLERRYGKSVYGLNAQSISELSDEVKPGLIDNLRKRIL